MSMEIAEPNFMQTKKQVCQRQIDGINKHVIYVYIYIYNLL